MRIEDLAGATAVLGDPQHTVVIPPDEGGAMGALRREVCRFAEGDDHVRRRAAVERELARLDPAALRRGARDHAAERTGDPQRVAREAPIATLLAALDAREADLTAAVAAARVYLAGEDDDATRRLLAAWAHVDHTTRIARATIVLQAGEATAGLILAALARGCDVDEVLLTDPPAPVLRRRGPTDRIVEIDLPAVQRVTEGVMAFSFGRRPCPAAEHAIALARGVLDAVSLAQ